jgi:hypothetical protein
MPRAIETLISAWIAEQERRERVSRRLEREREPEPDVTPFVRPPMSRQLDQGDAGQQDRHAA